MSTPGKAQPTDVSFDDLNETATKEPLVDAGSPSKEAGTRSTAVEPLGRVALISLGIGVLVSFILLFVTMEPGNPKVNRCAAVCVLMATLWVTEAIPLAATSLFPLVAFPILGVNSAAGTASQYFSGKLASAAWFLFS
jgi:di/tricarboxylate transporter